MLNVDTIICSIQGSMYGTVRAFIAILPIVAIPSVVYLLVLLHRNPTYTHIQLLSTSRCRLNPVEFGMKLTVGNTSI